MTSKKADRSGEARPTDTARTADAARAVGEATLGSTAKPPSEAIAGYRVSEQIGHLLRRAYQRHVAIFQQAVPDSQLTAAQFVVLCAIGERGHCDVHEVVRAVAIDETTVRGIVERLKWRELLNAIHAPGDARKTDLTLTPAGARLIEETVPYAHRITEQTFGDLDPGERAELVRLLRRISGMNSAT